MADVATAHSLLQDSARETSTEKREKREKRRREHTTERQARSPSRASWNVTPAAWKNSQGKGGLRFSGMLALWPLGSGTNSCLLFTETGPLVELF